MLSLTLEPSRIVLRASGVPSRATLGSFFFVQIPSISSFFRRLLASFIYKRASLVFFLFRVFLYSFFVIRSYLYLVSLVDRSNHSLTGSLTRFYPYLDSCVNGQSIGIFFYRFYDVVFVCVYAIG